MLYRKRICKYHADRILWYILYNVKFNGSYNVNGCRQSVITIWWGDCVYIIDKVALNYAELYYLQI